jgi:predicted  nucleic acid-binding Zn-ribbon protein
MSSIENLQQQIKDLDTKIKRLTIQKTLLSERLQRKEKHPNRVKEQNRNDIESKRQNIEENRNSIGQSNIFNQTT